MVNQTYFVHCPTFFNFSDVVMFGRTRAFPRKELALQRSFGFTRLNSVLHVICFLVFFYA